jgi:alpha-tubulin suppressor-like RCC1 family protein
MAPSSIDQATILDLPLELFTVVCQQLDLLDLVHVAAACKRFRHGDGGLVTVELPTKSPVVTALRELAFPGGGLVPSTRPTGCAESWVAYLARCTRQRRCREVPPLAASDRHSLFVDAAGRLLAGGEGAAVGHGDENAIYSDPCPVAAMAGVRVRSVATGWFHRLALGWDGRVYSWGRNENGHLGQGDRLTKPAPALVEGLEGVRGIAVAFELSLAVTQSGTVFWWGCALKHGAEDSLRPILVEGFGALRVRRVCAGDNKAFAIGEAGELSSWGLGEYGVLGHGDTRNQPSPKRVEALRGIRVSVALVGAVHALALAEDGQVYAWGFNHGRTHLGNPDIEKELLPKPIEALRGVRLASITNVETRTYAVADTGEVWAWGSSSDPFPPLSHGEGTSCPLPKPIESLRGIKVDAVAAGNHTLALADDGGVYV